MKRSDIHIPEVQQMYDKTLLGGGPIPAYGFGGRGFAHAIVTEGGKTLRMSGFPAISMNGVVGKNDMAAQATQALEHLRTTLKAGGATWDDIVHMIFYYTDREQFWAKCIPARIEFFKKHSKTGRMPCVTSVGVVNLMHPDMMLEIEATAVF
ncbi:MAG: RidA family protein [Pseudolabrys sp.]|nr:RidA family protein [Pseudolabrys sp.]